MAAAPAAAQSAAPATAGFTVSPPVWDFSAARGDTISKTYVLANAGTEDFAVDTEIRNFTTDPINGVTPEFTNDTTGYELKSYTTVSPSKVTIKPNSTAEVRVTVKVPQDAAPGGHFGAITFHSATLPSAGNVKVDQAVTSILLLKVGGEVQTQLGISEFTPAKGKKFLGIFTGGPITFNMGFTNSGNVHVQPDITLKASNILPAGDATIHKAAPGYTLPGTTRVYKVDWPSSNVPGIYKIKLSAVYGDNVTLEKTTTIVLIPPAYLIGLAVVIVIVILMAIVRRVKRHRSEHQKRKRKTKKITIEVDADEDDAPSGDHFR